MSDIKGVVIVRYDDDGEVSYYVAGGEAVRLFIVDERCDDDRVYEWTTRTDETAIKAILGDSPRGNCSDEKQAAAEAAILARSGGGFN